MTVWLVVGDVDYGPCTHMSVWASEAEALEEVQRWRKVGTWDHVYVEKCEVGKAYSE